MTKALYDDLEMLLSTTRESLSRALAGVDLDASFNVREVESAVRARDKRRRKLVDDETLSPIGRARAERKADDELAVVVRQWADRRLRRGAERRMELMASTKTPPAKLSDIELLRRELNDDRLLRRLEGVDDLLIPVIYAESDDATRAAMRRAPDRINVTKGGEVTIAPLVAAEVVEQYERAAVEQTHPEVVGEVAAVDALIAATESVSSVILNELRKDGPLPSDPDPVAEAAKGAA